ncbi:ankyrin repeats (3 copies) domain-containing protein [Trichoderma breve]|uniref:Ankyrin repeats (3 copies) domain-containing protein n=1 Tax=Trichoderma breve TaxID=2034170 RepID=A0A9W9B7D9_9HYPO|nr:ankyrin repeats (3 copies) domain-containing protein [Trichoderma breve]KAJ4854381.1 ankyrin repeats (3 copies) domain-containing protein [Trichoderma breve]
MQKLLARDDINVNIRSKKQTALEAALEHGHQDIVKLLFAKNDLDLTKFSVDQSLRRAYKFCHFELVQVLLAWACSKFPSRTPLSWSAEHGQTDVLNVLLLSEDGDTSLIANSKDPGGRTPLSLAAENGHVNTVRILIKKDADANLQDSDGRTPLWQAVENGHEGVVEVLTPDDTTTLLLLTQQGKQAAAIKLMPHEGLRLDQKDGQGRTALHLAALLGHNDIARHLLLLQNAEKIINCKDHTGETPLRLAIRGKHKIIVQELLNHKADSKDIEAKEWREAYNKPEYDTILLSKKREGEQNLDFPATILSREELSKTSTTFTSRL